MGQSAPMGPPSPPSGAPASELNDLYFDQSYTLDEPVSTTEKILIATFTLTFYIGMFLGLIMFFAAIKRLIEHSKNPNDPRNSVGGVFVLMIGASLLFGLQDTISIATNTLTGKGGFCFNYADKISNSDSSSNQVNFKSDDVACFNAVESELTKELVKELGEGGEDVTIATIANKLTVIFSIMQVIGLIYFVKGIYMLKAISDGTSGGQATYGKVIVLLIVSSLVIDMPNTVDILVQTAKNIAAT
jgi:hypothetical protein